MSVLYRILMLLALAVAASLTHAQTRNVPVMGFEADSIEQANLGNRKFHSAFRSFMTDSDSSVQFALKSRHGRNVFSLEPELQLAFGHQSNSSNRYSDAMAGLSAIYSFGEKLTVKASFIGGYTSPLASTSFLADSIGRFPQMDKYERKSDGTYLARYAEFYANYRPSGYLTLSVGKGKKFIGDGFRSVVLSASNSGMYYFDTDVDVGNFRYVFSLNGGRNYDNNDKSFRTLYMIYHAFSYNPARWLNIGGYETVMMIRRDSLDRTRFMDVHYLNPMLFFRPLEFSLGSPDNALMGVFGKIRFLKNHLIYAQFMLDDFNFKEIKEHNDTWNNKYAYQLGLKGFIGKFKYLVEYNYIRPYIYSHDKSVNTYSMYHQPLANPFGANLKELVLNLKYGFGFADVDLLVDHIEAGMDYDYSVDKHSMGNNIFKPYGMRKQNFGNYVGQGNNQKILRVMLNADFNLRQLRNLHPFLRMGTQDGDSDNKYFMIGIKTSKLYFDRSY